jgi:protease IV
MSDNNLVNQHLTKKNNNSTLVKIGLKLLQSIGKLFFVGLASFIVTFVVLITTLTLIANLVSSFSTTSNTDKWPDSSQLNFSYYSGNKNSNNKIAKLDLFGDVIDPYYGGGGIPFISSGGGIDGKVVKSQLMKLADDQSVKGVFIDLTTLGGSPVSAELIVQGIDYYKNKTQKPVYVYIDSFATSAGAWLSSNASYIIASPFAMVANVGVVGPTIWKYKDVTSISNPFSSYPYVETKGGVEGKPIYFGKYKTFSNPLNPSDDEINGIWANYGKELYDQFVNTMVKNRGIDEKVLREEVGAEGITAKEAIQYKLVDKLGNREEAINTLIEKLNLKDDYVVLDTDYSAGSDPIGSVLKMFTGIYSREKQVDPRASLCQPNRFLAYYGDVQKLCASLN